MFGKSKMLVKTYNGEIAVSQDAYEYIDNLKNEINILEDRNCMLTTKIAEMQRDLVILQGRLKSIAPIIERGALKPAVSEFCSGCKFAYLDGYSGRLIGCTKGCLCDDYKPKKED